MNLSRYEMETIINFNEEETTACIYTHNRALIRRLEKLAHERPDECRLEKSSHAGQAVDYIVPKKWIKVSPPRVASEAQRAASRAALQKARN